MRTGILAGLLLATCAAVYAQDVLLLHDGKARTADEKQLRDLTDFLGLHLQTLEITSDRQEVSPKTLQSYPALLAILAPTSLLSSLSPALVHQGEHPGTSAIPILIFGIDQHVQSSLLSRWSNGAFDRCDTFNPGGWSKTIEVARNSVLTGTLNGLRLPEVIAPACRLAGEATQQGQALLTADGVDGPAPLLYEVPFGRREIFFVPQLRSLRKDWLAKPSGLAPAFSSVAPFLLFLRHVAGDFAWHLDGHYANFTVDDPWLVQPYGDLDYEHLLLAMEEHHFHTTVAFVPWNYDRSRPDVVRLFHDNPQFYSLCLHGNNHAHREFGDYSQNPFEHQVADLRQGVARMEKLHALTNLPYDRFMVFPHAVAPQATFAALQANGFLGTANSINVPLDQSFPADPLFLLRPYTIAFGNLLSLSRYSTEAPISRVDLAIQSFLGNPMLFYAHQAFFAHGTDAFDSIADEVNQMDPDLQWRSLGDIAHHLYEVRRRNDGNMDLRMLSNEMTLSPSLQHDVSYYVSLASPASNSITGVEIEGAPVTYRRTATGVMFQLASSRRQTQVVRIRYSNNPNTVGVEIGKTDLKVSLLRRVSDFRDLYLSRNPLGRTLTEAYYHHQGEAWEGALERRWALALILVCLGIGTAWSTARQRRSSSATSAIEHLPS